LGLQQADLAETVGISASYLNLIEHNRRRIAEPLLARLAEALGQPPQSFHEGVGGTVLDDLRAAAARLPGAEIDRSEDFAARFPGWAATVIGLHQRVAGLERALEAMNDRMSHDPHLSASLHEVLSAVASVRSTAAILADTEDIEPEWQEQGLASPQEELEAWLAANDWKAGEVRGLASGAARQMAAAWQAQAARDLAAYPAAGFAQALAELGPDPAELATRFGGDVLAAFRRIALQPGMQAGLVVCDASGTLTFRKPISGFALPRFGAACPLWPLFAALARPMTPIETVIETAGPQPLRFRVRAFCQPRFPQGFRGPELREAAMLILPELGRGGEALVIGSTCRICQRAACPARREPSILSA
jgi:transcriptional regulator with XRE-family HTH domain